MLLTIKDAFKAEILTSFHPSLKMDERIVIIADVEMFNPKEDKYIFAQKKGDAPLCFQVYLDGVFISLFYDRNPKLSQELVQKAAVLAFWKGLHQAYKDGRVHLVSPQLRADIEQQEKTDALAVKEKQKKKINSLPESTPVQKMAKQIVKNVAKKGNHVG